MNMIINLVSGHSITIPLPETKTKSGRLKVHKTAVALSKEKRTDLIWLMDEGSGEILAEYMKGKFRKLSEHPDLEL